MTEQRWSITEDTCRRVRGYVDQHEGMCWCGFDSEDWNDQQATLDHIVHSLVDDWQGLMAEATSAENRTPTYADGIKDAADLAALYDTGADAAKALRITARIASEVSAKTECDR